MTVEMEKSEEAANRKPNFRVSLFCCCWNGFCFLSQSVSTANGSLMILLWDACRITNSLPEKWWHALRSGINGRRFRALIELLWLRLWLRYYPWDRYRVIPILYQFDMPNKENSFDFPFYGWPQARSSPLFVDINVISGSRSAYLPQSFCYI